MFGFRKNKSSHQTLRIEPDELPADHVFWTLTIYEMQGTLFSMNVYNRYLINPHFERQLKRDADGGITFYIQHESPGRKRAANWLPAPMGIFWMALWIYKPEEGAVEYSWPELKAIKS